MSASSQKQAFNALLFFFRHVLGQEFGQTEGVVRAKQGPHIPMVLTRQEIDRKKDRTVPLPRALLPALNDQLDRVIDQHDRDLEAGYDGVFVHDLFPHHQKPNPQRSQESS